MIIISAMTRDHVIGNEAGDAMPWNVPEEFSKFLEFVDGQAVIMGRKSFEIFKGDMNNSTLFIVSRSNVTYPNAVVCSSLEEAAERASATGKVVYIAGGGTIYKQALPIVEKMYLSYIKGEFTGSTYFPEFDPDAWTVTKREDHARFEFVVYERS